MKPIISYCLKKFCWSEGFNLKLFFYVYTFTIFVRFWELCKIFFLLYDKNFFDHFVYYLLHTVVCKVLLLIWLLKYLTHIDLFYKVCLVKVQISIFWNELSNYDSLFFLIWVVKSFSFCMFFWMNLKLLDRYIQCSLLNPLQLCLCVSKKKLTVALFWRVICLTLLTFVNISLFVVDVVLVCLLSQLYLIVLMLLLKLVGGKNKLVETFCSILRYETVCIIRSS